METKPKLPVDTLYFENPEFGKVPLILEGDSEELKKRKREYIRIVEEEFGKFKEAL